MAISLTAATCAIGATVASHLKRGARDAVEIDYFGSDNNPQVRGNRFLSIFDVSCDFQPFKTSKVLTTIGDVRRIGVRLGYGSQFRYQDESHPSSNGFSAIGGFQPCLTGATHASPTKKSLTA
jgi:hypothetical protein